ncbi:MAG TPA: DegT/DnrJ/EryC1/StrS family aminotransferase, partial [Bacteroidales bacterium]|nr:DegT/DnrJ/EryC1/StrS family aminotransferase [Bacteroidales bacterium]
NLGCFGDGGACFTNDENLAEKLGMIVNHGARVKYCNEIVGMNSRLDTIQAAVLNVKLKHLDDFIKRRRMAAEVYYQELSDVSFLQLPVKDQKVMHTFNQFTVRVFDENREKLKLFLKEKSIPAMVYYPVPLHLQPVFSPFFHRDFSLPTGEMLCSQVLSLPMHTELTSEKQLFITDTIKQFL